MEDTMSAALAWRKSARSNDTGSSCVEVAVYDTESA
jgi:hypothetical protein